MKEEDGVKLSQTLYARAEKIWPRYLCHPFVTQMADGTLPPEKFRYYMLQDLSLIHISEPTRPY